MPDYFVAKTGSNTNPGTEDFPWLTIVASAPKVLPGDTIWVKVGTYVESVMPGGAGGVSWVPGSSGSRINIKAYGHTSTNTKGVSVGTDAVIIRPSSGGGIGFNKNDMKYLTMAGFVVDGGAQSSGYGVSFNNDANNMILENMEIKNWGDDGIEGSTSNGSATTDRNNLFLNLYIHNNGTLHSGVAKHGVYWRSRNAIFDGCDISENDASSIQFYNSSNNARYAHNCIVRYCILRENMIEYHFQQEGLSIGPNMTNLKAHNNVIYRHRDVGIDMTNGTNSSGHRIFNNTIVDIGNGVAGNGENGIRITSNLYTDVQIKNNLIWDTGGAAIDDPYNVAVKLNNSLNAEDPLFSAYTRGSSWNLSLTESTPLGIATGGADVGSEYYRDFAGVTRSGSFSIGAFAFGDGEPPEPPLDPVAITPDGIVTTVNVNILLDEIFMQDNNPEEVGDYICRLVVRANGTLHNGL